LIELKLKSFRNAFPYRTPIPKKNGAMRPLVTREELMLWEGWSLP